MPCTVSVDQSFKEIIAPFILGNVGGRKGINDHEVHMEISLRQTPNQVAYN